VNDLPRLAGLIQEKNTIDREIAVLIGRPANLGHVGEYIAAAVFGIALEDSAAHKGSDGRFVEGPLAGRTVNIKWYTQHGGLLDMTPEALPDFYLVLTGPKSSPISSRGAVHPWVIESVFLFDARELLTALRARGVKTGIATSVAGKLWIAAEIYPVQRNQGLLLSDEQRRLLDLFRAVEPEHSH